MNVKVVIIVLNYALILLVLIIAHAMKDMKWNPVMVGLKLYIYANSHSYVYTVCTYVYISNLKGIYYIKCIIL